MKSTHFNKTRLALMMLPLSLVGIGHAQQQQAMPATIGIGSPAPEFKVGEFIKGTAIQKLEKGKIYVINFWSVQYGDSVAAAPKLTEFSKKYPDVTFVGLFVTKWHDGSTIDTPALIDEYLQKRGDQIEYRLATDTSKGDMVATWLIPAAQWTLPGAFIIDKDQKIAWIGPAGAIEPILAKIVSGDYDYKQLEAQKQALVKRAMDAAAAMKELGDLQKTGDFQRVLERSDELHQQFPEDPSIMVIKIDALSRVGRQEEALSMMHKLYEENKSHHSIYMSLATFLVNSQAYAECRDYELVLKFINRYLEFERPSYFTMGMYADAYYSMKNYEKAVEYQNKALNMLNTFDHDDPNIEAAVAYYEKRLKMFQAALETKD